MEETLTALQNILNEEIPITQSLGVTVVAYGSDGLTLKAPLAPNINHKCTVFGGSLYSVMVLSGWGLVYQLMAEQGLIGHIVIQQSEIEYLKPVAEDFLAHAKMPGAGLLDRFVSIYRKRGRSRIEIEIIVEIGDELAARMLGRYVIHQ